MPQDSTSSSSTSSKHQAAPNAHVNLREQDEPPMDFVDFQEQCVDEYGRFIKPSHTVGHVLEVSKGSKSYALSWDMPTPTPVQLAEKKAEWDQFYQTTLAPAAESSEDLFRLMYRRPVRPMVRPLKNIRKFRRRNGAWAIQAESPGGTKHQGKRWIEVNNHTFWVTSPIKEYVSVNGKNIKAKYDPYLRSKNRIPALFSSKISVASQKELEAEAAEAEAANPEKTVRGSIITLKANDIPKREEMTRSPSQNDVMGGAATKAGTRYLDERNSECSALLKTALEKNERVTDSVYAREKSRMAIAQWRWEWLHATSYSCTPLHIKPQRKSNLAAAPKFLNSSMMQLEYAAKWIAKHRKQATTVLEGKFKVIPGTDIMRYGFLMVTFKIGRHHVQLYQELYPHEQYPSFPKRSDIAQTILMVDKLMHLEAPDHVTEIKVSASPDDHPFSSAGAYKSNYGPIDSVKNTPLYVQRDSIKLGSSQYVPINFSKADGVTLGSQDKVPTAPDKSDDIMDCSRPETSKEVIMEVSNQVRCETKPKPEADYRNSIVCLACDNVIINYASPYQVPKQSGGLGSGVIIKVDNDIYILTNAHVVENATCITVRMSHSDDLYIGEVAAFNNLCDMALVKVRDKKFLQLAKPLTLGGMVNVKDKISVHGFPVGGENISRTQGTISRIDCKEYSEDAAKLLVAQTEAAINFGNSGGPAILDDKIIGLAFSKCLNNVDNIGYLIPVPVIKHFLTAFKAGRSIGFPEIPIKLQHMKNPTIRAHHNMQPTQSGLRIVAIDKSAGITEEIKAGDILLNIDGVPVSNSGKCYIPDIQARVGFEWLFYRKQVGEKISIDVLQSGSVKRVEFKLKHRYRQNKMIDVLEFNQRPTYYVGDGALLQPLTQNLLYANFATNLACQQASSDGDDESVKDMLIEFAHASEWLRGLSKDHPDDQIIVMNGILPSPHTYGYSQHFLKVVKEVNGVSVKNMQQVVLAFENNRNPSHVVKMLDGQLVVLKRLTPEQRLELLARNHIDRDRSDNLMPEQDQAIRPNNMVEEAPGDANAQGVEQDVMASPKSVLDQLSGQEIIKLLKQKVLQPLIDRNLILSEEEFNQVQEQEQNELEEEDDIENEAEEALEISPEEDDIESEDDGFEADVEEDEVDEADIEQQAATKHAITPMFAQQVAQMPSAIISQSANSMGVTKAERWHKALTEKMATAYSRLEKLERYEKLINRYMNELGYLELPEPVSQAKRKPAQAELTVTPRRSKRLKCKPS